MAKKLNILIRLLGCLALTLMCASMSYAQPQASNVVLDATTHNHLVNDDLVAKYDLTGGADSYRTATAWYKDSNPMMELYMVYEGGSSNALLDMSGNSHTVATVGNVSAATAWDETGGHEGGGAFLFSSSSGANFCLDAGTVMNTGAYTKACWLKRKQIGSSLNIMSSSTTTGYHVLYASSSVGHKVTAFHSGGAKVSDPVALVDDVWFHYVVTYDGTSDAMILYRNGAQVASGTAPAFTDQTLFVGGFTAASGNFWDGYLDDVRVYDYALSSDQILALYNGSDSIRSSETTLGEVWQTEITPFSSTGIGSSVLSNTLTIMTDPPIVSDIPGETIVEGGSFATITLDNYVTDPNHLDNEIIWTFSGNTELIVDITSRIATISTPNSDWYGDETITFRATDPDGLYNEDNGFFSVTGVNDGPVVSGIPNQTIDEGLTFETVDLNIYVNDVDNLDSEIDWDFSGNDDLTVVIDEFNLATITTPNEDWNGTKTITFTATDPGLLFDSDQAIFTVTAVNDPPIVSDIPNQTVDEGLTFETIDLNSYVSDVDNLDSEIDWDYSGNSDLLIGIDGSNIATITIPNTDWNGTEIITFTATDPDLLTDSDPATFSVTAVNDPPVVSGIPDQTVDEGDPFATIILDSYVSDIDNTPDQMVWTATSTELIVTIDDIAREATVTVPYPEWAGSETITLRATDPGTLWDEDEALFTVIANPTVSGVTITPLNPITSENISCSYLLEGSATRDAVAWYKDSSPLMNLYMVNEGGADNALLDHSGNNHTVWDPKGQHTSQWSSSSGYNGSGTFTYNNNLYFEVPGSFPTNSSYTKAVWIKRELGATSYNILSSKQVDGGHTFLATNTHDNHLCAGQAGNWYFLESVDTIFTGIWYHAAVTYDAFSYEMVLYIDGQQVDIGTLPEANRVVTDDTLLIGAFANSSQWAGQIDDVHIYNYALSPEQILELYNNNNTIHANETDYFEEWQALVTPFSSDDIGPSEWSNIVSIGFLNNPPVLDSILPDTVDVGRQITFDVFSSDPDPQTDPELSVDILPTGATFTDHEDGTGTLDWIPDFDQYGNIEIIFRTIDDSLAYDSQLVVITVLPDTISPEVTLISPPEDSISSETEMLLSMDVFDEYPLDVFVYGGTDELSMDLIHANHLDLSGSLEYLWDAQLLQPELSSTLGLWHFDEFGSSTVSDESENGNTGTLIGDPEWLYDGKFGNSIKYDGIDDYVVVADDPSLDIDPTTGSVTLEAWVKPDIAGDGQLRSILAKRSYSKVPRIINYEMILNFNRSLVFASGDDMTTLYVCNGVVLADTWSYVAITVDASLMEAKFYINGQYIETINDVELGPVHSEPLYIGAAGENSENFMGNIDEVRISNRVLSETEILHNSKLPHGNYYWNILVTDPSGNSDTSETRMFSVFSLDYEAPILLEPPDELDLVLYDMTPTFVWSSFIGPLPDDTIYYKLKLFHIEGTTPIIDSLTLVSDTSYHWQDSLKFEEDYCWWVEAWINTDTGIVEVSTSHNCFSTWMIGDVDMTRDVNVADLVYMVDFLFRGGPPITPEFVGDVDQSCNFNVADLVYMVDYLFKGGPDPQVGCE